MIVTPFILYFIGHICSQALTRQNQRVDGDEGHTHHVFFWKPSTIKGKCRARDTVVLSNPFYVEIDKSKQYRYINLCCCLFADYIDIYIEHVAGLWLHWGCSGLSASSVKESSFLCKISLLTINSLYKVYSFLKMIGLT